MGRTAAFERAGGLLARALGCAVLALAPGMSAPAAAAQIARPSPAADPLAALARWTSDYRRLGASLDPDSDASLGPALAALRVRLMATEEFENDALLLLCDLASIAGAGSEAGIAQGCYVANERESQVRDQARAVLRSALDAPSGQGRGYWLATTVLAATRDQPLARRIAVAEALTGRYWESTLLALFTSSSVAERGLREVSVSALSGWKSETVDRYLARLTLRALREPEFLSTEPLLRHFAERSLPGDSSAAMEVAAALAKSSVSPDWREAVRRIPLTRVLSNELAVPQLIEALSLWHERGLGGASSRRVEALLVEELELRSKKRLGMAPERWTYWWKVQRANPSAASPTDSAGQESEARTQAAFFGLRPWTDRVVFVIDRSGSMAGPFGTDRASRYSEALRQLSMFLQQLGPRTHFNLVLFSDSPRAWSTCLKPAKPAMIASALDWARNAPPQGGTMLRPAVSRALELDPRTGLPDLDELEADTVIVLCDGGTAEGPAWVSPLMRAVRESACLRFDCVQIGNSGDGTLEALALESGGQFVRVDP